MAAFRYEGLDVRSVIATFTLIVMPLKGFDICSTKAYVYKFRGRWPLLVSFSRTHCSFPLRFLLGSCSLRSEDVQALRKPIVEVLA